MTRRVFARLGAVVAVSVNLAAVQARATQAEATRTMTANGMVVSVSASSALLVIATRAAESMTFVVDSRTRVFKRGTAAKLLPSPPERRTPTIAEVVHRGDLVTVKYHVTGITMRATDVLVVRQVAGR